MSTTTKNLGRVSIVPKGEWNSNNTYIRLDLVNYNGSSYIAKQNVPVNINLDNSNYWMLVAAKGDSGDKSDSEGVTEEQLEAILASYRTTIVQNEIDAAQNTKINKNIEDITTINELIPVQANAINKLADKNFVNSSIQTNSAHFRGNWVNWAAVPTNPDLYPADDDGVHTPTSNDYMVIQDASDYLVPTGETALEGTWRFKYSGVWATNERNGWQKEYQVNETPLSAAQLAALNSGATADLIAQIETNATNNTRQDASINNKQPKIMVNGILKGNGEGGVSAAVAGIDYLPTSALYAYRSSIKQDEIDNAQDTKINKNIDDIDNLKNTIEMLQPIATSQDVGKALIVKTVDSETGKPIAYEYGEAGSDSGDGGDSDSTLIAGDGIDIVNDVISNTQGIEYIVGTQTAATSKWTGVSKDETLKVGKIIAYYLPFAGTSTAATLSLIMSNGTTTAGIPLQLKPGFSVTTNFSAGNVIILIYDGTYWRVSASYDTDTNTYPTGYCVTNGNVAAKTAQCTYGYRDDPNYFMCVFKNANTAENATLAITTYALEAAPIYVNGMRTSSTNTFGAGVILFLFYNNAYYCYNDGRLPILVNGTVTSVQEYVVSSGGTANALPLAGGTMSGNINMGSNKVTNLSAPTANGDATSKGYVDNLITIGSTQPTTTQTKIWLDPADTTNSTTEIWVPTINEMNEALEGKEQAGLGISNASVGDFICVSAVDANGKPTSWTRVAQSSIINSSNIVSVSDTQPIASENKLWVDTDAGAGTSYQIPTVAEMEAADAQVAAEIGVVITGKRPSIAVTAGQYVIVRNSTISGITDGLYTANAALSPSTDVTAANLTSVSKGGLNSLSTRLDDAFKNITATATGSTTAGENAWVYVPVTIPTGYRMIAVNSLRFTGTDATYLVLRGFEVDNSNSRVTLYFKNVTTSTTINYTAVIWITCVKSDLF